MLRCLVLFLGVQELSCQRRLACSRCSWQLQRKSLGATAYVCSAVAGWGNPPFWELHCYDLGPWKLANSNSLPPSSITQGTVLLK